VAPLLDWLQVRPPGCGALFPPVYGYSDLCPPLLGIPYNAMRQHWLKAMSRLVETGALPRMVRLTQHSLRRSRATHVWNATGDLGAVALLLGHRDLASTWIYLTEANPFLNTAASDLMRNRKGA